MRKILPGLLTAAMLVPLPAVAAPPSSGGGEANASDTCSVDEPGFQTCYFQSKGDCSRAVKQYYGRRAPYLLTLMSQCEPSRDPQYGSWQLEIYVL